MHCHGWRSIYCIPERTAFKVSVPRNLCDGLHKMFRWALGSTEILLSKHCPIWYGYGGGLKWLERLSYINATVYPWTSIPLVAYCTLPAVCLLTGKFIVPEVWKKEMLVIAFRVSQFIKIFKENFRLFFRLLSSYQDLMLLEALSLTLSLFGLHKKFITFRVP